MLSSMTREHPCNIWVGTMKFSQFNVKYFLNKI